MTWPIRSVLKFLNGKKEIGIKQIDNGNIENILEKENLVLLNFSAEWCGPCLLMNKILKEFDSGQSDIYVVKINADTNTDILIKYGIRGISQFILINKGEEVKRHAGPMSLHELQRFCSNN